eukprot:300794_1
MQAFTINFLMPTRGGYGYVNSELGLLPVPDLRCFFEIVERPHKLGPPLWDLDKFWRNRFECDDEEEESEKEDNDEEYPMKNLGNLFAKVDHDGDWQYVDYVRFLFHPAHPEYVPVPNLKQFFMVATQGIPVPHLKEWFDAAERNWWEYIDVPNLKEFFAIATKPPAFPELEDIPVENLKLFFHSIFRPEPKPVHTWEEEPLPFGMWRAEVEEGSIEALSEIEVPCLKDLFSWTNEHDYVWTPDLKAFFQLATEQIFVPRLRKFFGLSWGWRPWEPAFVPDLKAFFALCPTTYYVDTRSFGALRDVPVTNLKEFFGMCHEAPTIKREYRPRRKKGLFQWLPANEIDALGRIWVPDLKAFFYPSRPAVEDLSAFVHSATDEPFVPRLNEFFDLAESQWWETDSLFVPDLKAFFDLCEPRVYADTSKFRALSAIYVENLKEFFMIPYRKKAPLATWTICRPGSLPNVPEEKPEILPEVPDLRAFFAIDYRPPHIWVPDLRAFFDIVAGNIWVPRMARFIEIAGWSALALLPVENLRAFFAPAKAEAKRWAVIQKLSEIPVENIKVFFHLAYRKQTPGYNASDVGQFFLGVRPEAVQLSDIRVPNLKEFFKMCQRPTPPIFVPDLRAFFDIVAYTPVPRIRRFVAMCERTMLPEATTGYQFTELSPEEAISMSPQQWKEYVKQRRSSGFSTKMADGYVFVEHGFVPPPTGGSGIRKPSKGGAYFEMDVGKANVSQSQPPNFKSPLENSETQKNQRRAMPRQHAIH